MADKRHIKREVVRLNGVVEAMEAEKAKHSTTIQSLRSANNSLSKEVTTLKAQLDETTKSKESHRKELDTLRTANLNLRGEMTSLTRELHSLRELTDTSKKTMESMKKEVDEIKLAKNSAIMEKNRVVKELEVKTTACETLTNNLKQEKQALSKSQQEAFLIKNDLSRKTEAFSELQSIIDIINSEAADMKLEIDSLKESLTQASLDNQRLAVEVEELKNRDDVLDNQQESSSEIARLNAEISCLKSERERLNCALEIEERERLELAKKNRDYDSAIEEIKVEFGKVMDERDEYKMMQCAESTKIAELENKLQELNTDNVNVQEQHEITLKQVRELRKEIGDLEVVKVELEVSVENTTNELELMRSEVVRHKADLEKEKEQADVAQSRSMLLMEQLDAEKEKYDTVFMELESQVQAVSSLNTELDVYKDKLEQSTRRYAQSQAELETARSRVAEYESETSRTTSKLQESGQQYIELKAEKERLTADLALFTEVKEVLETKLEQLTRQLDSQDVRIQESEVALDEERARVRELEHELNAVRMDELEPLRSQLHDSAARLAETEGENQVLKDYLTESQDIIRSHEMEIQVYEANACMSWKEKLTPLPFQESVAQLGVLQQQVEKKEEINQAWRKAYEKNKVTVSLFRKKKDEEISELQKEVSFRGREKGDWMLIHFIMHDV